jgi:hypothetical protein
MQTLHKFLLSGTAYLIDIHLLMVQSHILFVQVRISYYNSIRKIQKIFLISS